jgi:hypothetical protein
MDGWSRLAGCSGTSRERHRIEGSTACRLEPRDTGIVVSMRSLNAGRKELENSQ